MFIKFVRKMVKWNPEDRSSAGDLLKDPWLYADFSSSPQGGTAKE